MKFPLKFLVLFVLFFYCEVFYAQIDKSKICTTYYISTSLGCNSNDGLSETSPLHDISALPFKCNVCIKLKCGDVFFERINGFSNSVIESYGKGDNPLLCGFKILTNPKAWNYSSEGFWFLDLSKEENFTGYLANKALDRNIANNVGLIYDAKKDFIYGHLVQFKSELKKDGDFYMTELHKATDMKRNPLDTLCFMSSKSPQTMGKLCFSMNGVGISGLSNCYVRNIAIMGFSRHGIAKCIKTTIEDCSIDLIGGQNFIKDRWWSRLGNGIEFWADDKGVSGNTVLNCLISRCYDCGVTIQGNGANINNPSDIHFVNNRFYHCRQAFEHFINPSNNTPVQYDNCSFVGNVCYEMGETEMNSLDERCANILNYEEEVRPLNISNNIFYGSAHHCGFCFAPGIKNNIVYIIEGQYLNHYHVKKAFQTIYANTKKDIMIYKQRSGDESFIVILKPNSSEQKRIRKKIKRKVNWTVNGSLRRFIRDI